MSKILMQIKLIYTSFSIIKVIEPNLLFLYCLIAMYDYYKK